MTPDELRKSYKRSEHAIQVDVIHYLRRVLPKSIRAVAVANSPRSKVMGALEKARGTWAGFPDVLLVGSFFGLMEIKREGGKLQKNQQEWRDWCRAHQVPHAVIRSIADAEETLVEWGLIRG